MGHTVWSQRMVSEGVLSELRDFGKALRREDRIAYERLLKLPLKHLGSIGFASSLHVWAFLLMSMMMEQEKKFELMGRELLELKEMMKNQIMENEMIEEEHEGMAYRRVQEQEQDSALDEDS